jgi:hypothetical protein
MRLIVALLAIALTACAPLQTVPEPAQPVVHTVIQRVEIPTAVPCFREDQRPVQPIFPIPTVLPANATFGQKQAAEAADSIAMDVYARAMVIYGASVDKLFLQCLDASNRVIPQGGKP